jgi:hypothetical protein
MKPVLHMNDLHEDHKLWMNELELYRDELKIYNHRLEELVVKYTNKHMLAELEHFQNTFIHHNNVIDELIHEINEHEKKFEAMALENPVANDKIRFKPHTEHEDKILLERKIYNELKTDFTNFLRKYM